MPYIRYRTVWRALRPGATPVTPDFITKVEDGLVDHEARIGVVETSGGGGSVDPTALNTAVTAAIPPALATYFIAHPTSVGPDSITTSELADGAVATANILDANVTAAKLAANAVVTAKIADANVTQAKLDSSTAAKLMPAGGSVGQAVIKDGSNNPAWGNPTAVVGNASVSLAKLATDVTSKLLPDYSAATTNQVPAKQADGTLAWVAPPTTGLPRPTQPTARSVVTIRSDNSVNTEDASMYARLGYAVVTDPEWAGGAIADGYESITTTGTDNTAAFAAAIASGRPIYVPPCPTGRAYAVDGALYFTDRTVIGGHARRSVITQRTKTLPVAFYGGANCTMERLWLSRPARTVTADRPSGATTDKDICGLRLGRVGIGCVIDRVETWFSNTGFYCGEVNPDDTTSYLANAVLSNCRAGYMGDGGYGFYLNPSSAGSTGFVMQNLYVNNHESHSTPHRMAAGYYLGNCSSLNMDTVNLEGSTADHGIMVAGVRTLHIRAFHIENMRFSSNNGAFVYALANSGNKYISLNGDAGNYSINSSVVSPEYGVSNYNIVRTERGLKVDLQGFHTGDLTTGSIHNASGTLRAFYVSSGAVNANTYLTGKDSITGIAHPLGTDYIDAAAASLVVNGTIGLSRIAPGSTVTVQKDNVVGSATFGNWPASYAADGTPNYVGGSASAGVRPTTRTDVTVQWKGADPAPAIVSSGAAGMIDGVDVRLRTP